MRSPAAFLLVCAHRASSLALLSDMPTPSFILDMDALQRAQQTEDGRSSSGSFTSPTIRCGSKSILLVPDGFDEGQLKTSATIDYPPPGVSVAYLHSTVVRGRDESEADEGASYLAEIDLSPTLCNGEAQLVLGLNNHHVGGYYWARSAGVGASMEAPGTLFGPSNDPANKNGIVRWTKENAWSSNSNDGKRSEWINFVRRGDTVQLVPKDGPESLLNFVRCSSQTDPRIFGISSKGRPLGSEPAVVCTFVGSVIDSL